MNDRELRTGETEGEGVRAAVAVTEDGKITDGHFGDAPRILKAELRTGRVIVAEEMENPIRASGSGHGGERKLRKAGEFLGDVRILVAGRKSPNFVKLRREKGKWPLVGSGDAAEVLEWISRNLEELAAWFEDEGNVVFRIP